MAADQQFCLRWNNHQSTLISVFDSLLENGTLVDCTLAAEGQYLKAHKVVLSACSPYLETLLSQHYEKHPIVILKDVKFTELKSMMDYMYRGEVNISQDQLGTFLKAAESLQIKGLSDNGDDARDVGSTNSKRQETPSSRPSVTQVRTPIESKRPAPSGDISDASRDGSISPSSIRKRRRTRRPSQGDDPDSHLDTTSNTCDLPIQAQSTPLPVPNSTVVPTPVQNLPKQIVKQEPPSRLDHSPIAPESGLLKEKIEPPSEPLLEPKTEYLDYMNNENSIEVEDLTLDDDEEDLDSSMDTSRPGPSHGDMSNQGYQWPMSGDQSGTDEIFMAAQQAVGAAAGQQRDSQGGDLEFEKEYKPVVDVDEWNVLVNADERKPIFVSAPCVGVEGSTEFFFSELNNPPTKQVFKNSLEKGIFLGKETEKVQILNYSVSKEDNYNSSKKNDRTQSVGSVLGIKRGVKVTHNTKNVRMPCDTVKPSARQKYLSSRGRRRKLLTWSGESFNVTDRDIPTLRAKEEMLDESQLESDESNDFCHVKCKQEECFPSGKSEPKFGLTVTNIQHSTSKGHALYKYSDNIRKKVGYKCVKCGISYSFLKGLRTHQRHCKVQVADENKQVNDIKNMFRKKQPKRYDFAIKPYGFECRKCGLQYRYLRGLRTHQRLVCDREPRFSCPFCPLKTHTRQSLRKHVERRHMDLI